MLSRRASLTVGVGARNVPYVPGRQIERRAPAQPYADQVDAETMLAHCFAKPGACADNPLGS